MEKRTIELENLQVLVKNIAEDGDAFGSRLLCDFNLSYLSGLHQTASLSPTERSCGKCENRSFGLRVARSAIDYKGRHVTAGQRIAWREGDERRLDREQLRVGQIGDSSSRPRMLAYSLRDGVHITLVCFDPASRHTNIS